jgi:hypothetical protein
MNKRIEELAKQAGLMCLYDYGPEEDPHAMVVGQKDMELFAELIVQECIAACSRANEIRYFVGNPLPEAVVLNCMIEIERTFGVEK